MLFGELFASGNAELKGERVTLRHPRKSDYRAWAELRRNSRDFLEPWEPRWAPDELARRAWRERLRQYVQDRRRGHGHTFFVLERQTGALAGGISIGNVRRGVAQSGQIGYWMGEKFAGHGLMGEALSLVVEYGFRGLGLHRIEAACIPDNKRSIRVLEKAGFSREGLLRSYLRINGAWRDHLLFALIDEDFQDKKDRGPVT
ncbi:MAG: GNAT family protein [Rhizobiaceae bacterium]